MTNTGGSTVNTVQRIAALFATEPKSKMWGQFIHLISKNVIWGFNVVMANKLHVFRCACSSRFLGIASAGL